VSAREILDADFFNFFDFAVNNSKTLAILSGEKVNAGALRVCWHDLTPGADCDMLPP
jgi:hypothetical protein